jgi:hypothetical protein
MLPRKSIGAMLIAAALLAAASGAQAFDDAKYPDFKGQWNRYVVPGVAGQPSFDQAKPWGKGQQAPLTPEYQAVLDESIADQQRGGLGNNVEHSMCVAAGMPFMMIAFRPLEFVVTPGTTYILIADYDPLRRVFTDGREFPKWTEPTFQGYSIGKWIDSEGTGRYDALEVETRFLKGPRVYDASGLPFHRDSQSIFKERFFLDKADPNLMHDVMTVFDHALTRPWTVDKRYVRDADPLADWPESICPEYNAQVIVGKEHYYLSGDGYLMPSRKGQLPPDARYFK